MKINKTTAIVCGIMTILSGTVTVLMVLFAPQTARYNAVQGIISNVFTGFIVSLIVSTIGYFHERNTIIEKTENNLKNLYISLQALSKVTGNTLSEIHTTMDLSNLPFGNIAGLSALNVDYLNNMDLGLFNPFCTRSKLAQLYANLTEFQQVAYNIKNISMELQTKALEYHNLLLSMQNGGSYGMQFDPVKVQNLDMLKNLINIRTAKFHEYVSGQALVLEKNIEMFYDCKGNKRLWEKIKSSLLMQVEDIVKG